MGGAGSYLNPLTIIQTNSIVAHQFLLTLIIRYTHRIRYRCTRSNKQPKPGGYRQNRGGIQINRRNRIRSRPRRICGTYSHLSTGTTGCGTSNKLNRVPGCSANTNHNTSMNDIDVLVNNRSNQLL